MPFVGAAEAGAIVEAASPGRVVVAAMAGQLEPLLGLYPSGARDALLDGALRGASMRTVVADLDPLLVELPPRVLRSINTELALTEADRELRQPRSIT